LVAAEDVAEGGFEVFDRTLGSEYALMHLFVVAVIAVIIKESCGRIIGPDADFWRLIPSSTH
jgi:hypothetical protein